MMSIRPKKFNVTPEKPIVPFVFFFLPPVPPAGLLSRFVTHPESSGVFGICVGE